MDEFFFVLECAVKGWKPGTVDVLLNGIPIVTLGGGKPSSFSDPVNEFLLSGENQVLLVIQPPDQPKWEDIVKQTGAQASANLVRYPFGAIVGGPDGESLGGVEWKMPEFPPEDLEGPENVAPLFPQRASGKVDAGERPGRPWRWEAGQPLELNDELRQQVLDLLTPIHEGLQSGDASPFLTAASMRFEDLATAYASFDPEERQEMIREGTVAGMMEPLAAGSFDPRLWADGRLLECRAADGQPLLREKPGPEGDAGYYEMFLAKIDGALRIVR